MCLCSSKEHVFEAYPHFEDGKNHHLYLSLNDLNAEDGFFSRLFSSKAEFSFHGDITIDHEKEYNNIHGNFVFSKDDKVNHYEIYNAQNELLFDFDSGLSFIDGQGISYFYFNPSDFDLI